MYNLDLDAVFVVVAIVGLVIDDLPTKEKAFADVASVANKATAALRLKNMMIFMIMMLLLL